VSYAFNLLSSGGPSHASLFLSVENLFDRDPDIFISATRTGAQGYTYPAPFDEDVIGRYFTAGLKLEF
jgi:outer membrane receptor protein involved in Fe transport